MKDPEIIDIDGKHYIELPCKPGDRLYRVHLYFGGEVEDNCFIASWRISPTTFYTVEDILRSLDEFGKHVFFTREDAEVELNRRLHI